MARTAYAGLKPKHQKFVDGYMENGSVSGAYRRAGFKKEGNHSAESNGSRLITRDDVKAAVEERKEELADARMLSLEQKKAILSIIAVKGIATDTDGRMFSPCASIQAIQELNRMDGDHAPKAGKQQGSVTFVQDFESRGGG